MWDTRNMSVGVYPERIILVHSKWYLLIVYDNNRRGFGGPSMSERGREAYCLSTHENSDAFNYGGIIRKELSQHSFTVVVVVEPAHFQPLLWRDNRASTDNVKTRK